MQTLQIPATRPENLHVYKHLTCLLGLKKHRVNEWATSSGWSLCAYSSIADVHRKGFCVWWPCVYPHITLRSTCHSIASRGCHGFHCRETLQLKESGVSGPRVTGNNFTAWNNARLLGSLGVLVSLSLHKACKTHTNSFLGTMWMRFRSPFFHDWDIWHVVILTAKDPFSALRQLLLGTNPSDAHSIPPWMRRCQWPDL